MKRINWSIIAHAALAIYLLVQSINFFLKTSLDASVTFTAALIAGVCYLVLVAIALDK